MYQKWSCSAARTFCKIKISFLSLSSSFCSLIDPTPSNFAICVKFPAGLDSRWVNELISSHQGIRLRQNDDFLTFLIRQESLSHSAYQHHPSLPPSLVRARYERFRGVRPKSLRVLTGPLRTSQCRSRKHASSTASFLFSESRA